jgi:hypothetical protein
MGLPFPPDLELDNTRQMHCRDYKISVKTTPQKGYLSIIGSLGNHNSSIEWITHVEYKELQGLIKDEYLPTHE